MRSPSSKPDSGSAVEPVRLPVCKSSAQRAVLLAALAEGPSTLHMGELGQDTEDLLSALAALGWDWSLDQNQHLKIAGRPTQLQTQGAPVLIGEGASTLRFLAPVLAAYRGLFSLRLGPGLGKRPHQDLLTVLAALGAKAERQGNHLEITATGWQVQELNVPTGTSSQFLSGLWMAAGEHDMTYHLQGPLVSQGYLSMTMDWLHRFRGPDVLTVEATRVRQKAGFGQGQEIPLPADTSALVFFAVAAVLLQQEITVAGTLHPLHPDAAALRMLEQAELLQVLPLAQGNQLIPMRPPRECQERLSFDLGAAPDCGPALAVLAAGLPQGISFRNPGRLRYKESDRLDGMKRLVARIGGDLHEQADGSLSVTPASAVDKLAMATKEPFACAGDHRLAMAAGIAGVVWGSFPLDDPTVVAKSFPSFWEPCARLV